VKYLKGSELDYVETPTEAGFTVNNPNVMAKCPCGHHDIYE
jgi:Fe-S cluster assembly iron-binding protein IscA